MRAFAGLPLETDRLLLRPLREDDADALLAIHADVRVMRYWSSPPWTDIERARAMIEKDRESATREFLRLGIERKGGEPLLGTCTFFGIQEASRRAEVGYVLASQAWGRGYMREALGALLRYGFETLDLNRVEADIDPRNEPSARLLERLGFRREGLLRERWIVSGEVSDSRLYGLLRSDWQAAAPSR